MNGKRGQYAEKHQMQLLQYKLRNKKLFMEDIMGIF